MSKVSQEEIVDLLHTSRFCIGALPEDLAETFGERITRRTLQRRLKELVDAGKIRKFGQGRATRYQRVVEKQPIIPDELPVPELSNLPAGFVVREEAPTKTGTPAESGPRYSHQSQEIVQMVREPQSRRIPVSYNRKFLEDYQPNVTSYLPEQMRTRLHAIGSHESFTNLPPGTHARKILDRLIIDLSWNSSRLEGNTYSLLETDELLARGGTEDLQRAGEATMLLNHKAAIEFLTGEPDELGFNRYTFLNLHATLAEDIIGDENAEGRIRQVPVGIGGSVYHPSGQPAVVEECFDLILNKAAEIEDPLECSFFLLVQLPYLQPFLDGNKRTSRLAANIPLIQHNLSPISFVDLPTRKYTDAILAIYELNRIEPMLDVFDWSYEQAAGRYMTIRQEVGEPDPVRLRYRFEIKDLVREVVVKIYNKRQAAAYCKSWAAHNITASDRAAFVTAVEEKLLGLSEYNLVNAKLRPSEFHAWYPQWKGE